MSDTWLESYRPYFLSSSEPDLNGVLNKIKSQFQPGNSGIYLARSIVEILDSKRLDGCQDWGCLWTHIFRHFGIPASYIQGVEIEWLDRYANDWRGDGWSGHVFIQADVASQPITFCATTARTVEIVDDGQGRSIIDGKFVLLFKGSGPGDFNATDQEGINSLLRPLVAEWISKIKL